MTAAENIRKTAHRGVAVQVEHFHAKAGANRLDSGFSKGKTLVYSDLKHVIIRILPKSTSEAGENGIASEAAENAILVSAHIDTVIAGYAIFHFLTTI